MIAREPLDRRRVTLFGHQRMTPAADGCVGIVADLTTRNRGDVLVEQRSERSDDARFRLPAFAQQDHVMAGENAVLDFGQHGVVVADDAGQHFFLGAQALEQVVAHLDTHRLGAIARVLELTEGPKFQQTLIHLGNAAAKSLLSG